MKFLKKIVGFGNSVSVFAATHPVASRRLFTLLVLAFVCVSSSFAEDGGIDKLDTWGEKLVSLANSTWLKAILLIALLGESVGVVVGGQQGGGSAILKKFAPWIIGTLILLSAQSICKFTFGDNGLQFNVKEL